MHTKLQTSSSFYEILELMPKYAKFMMKFLSRNKKLGICETVALTEKCDALLQRKLPPKLKDPGRFTIPCTIVEEFFSHACYNLGASINLMHMRLMKKLKLVLDLRFHKGVNYVVWKNVVLKVFVK